MKFDERNPNSFLNPPFFVSMATAAKFVWPTPIFLAYLVPLDEDVVPIKFHQFLFVPTMFLGGLKKFKRAAVAMVTKVQKMLNSLLTSTMFHEVWWKIYFFLNPPFFISMATAAKFVQPIAIFLAYLIQLDVDAPNRNWWNLIGTTSTVSGTR
jgi:hypothetical protein